MPTEVLGIHRGVGPESGGFPQKAFPLPVYQVTLGAGSTFGQWTLGFAFSVTDELPEGGAEVSPISVATAITGSSSSQSANVSYASEMLVNDYWLVAPGTATQEVVQIGAPTDATHVPGIFRNSHAIGTKMLKVHYVVTRWIIAGMTSVTSFSNFNLVRYGELPADVYDQMLVYGSYGTVTYAVDDAVPWIDGNGSTPTAVTVPTIVPAYDPGSVSATENPTNGMVLYAPTQTASGAGYPQFVVQHLVTTKRPPIFSVDYRCWWDN